METQALTRSAEERKVLKTHGREFLLFPDCSRVGIPKAKICGRIGTDALELERNREGHKQDAEFKLIKGQVMSPIGACQISVLPSPL